MPTRARQRLALVTYSAACLFTLNIGSGSTLMRLSIIGTFHAESGMTNVAELEAILERLQPDVIFAEIPSSFFERYRDGSHGTLEALTVARYRIDHQVAVIPVDIAEPDDVFFRNAKDMFDKVERTSPDYRCMMDRHSLDISIGGFAYLNSDRFIQTLAHIHAEILATLDWIGDHRLREVYDLWNEHSERRDTAMVNSIADYAASSGFDHGVLLIGAAHRRSIFNKAQTRLGTCVVKTESDFSPLSQERA